MSHRLAIVVLVFAAPAWAQDPSYSKQVRPILAKYCVECHNAKVSKGGLDLESVKSMNAGGENGVVIVAGKSAESSLVRRMDGRDKPIMPPQKITVRPTKEEIERIRAWVDAGAKDDGPGKVVLAEIAPKAYRPAPVSGVAFLGGKLVVANGSFVTRDSRTLTLKNPVTALAARDNVLVLAQGRPGEGGRIAVGKLDPFGGIVIADTDVVLSDATQDLAIDAAGRFAAVAGYDSRVTILELKREPNLTAEVVATLKDHSDSVHGAAMRPDGKRLATVAADRTLKIWDVPSGKLLQTLSEATDWLYAVAWSPDGRTVATGGVDKSIRIYQWTGDGAEAKLIRATFAHEGPVLKLGFTSDGSTLFSLGQDRVVKAWDVATMSERRVFPKLSDDALALAVHPTAARAVYGLYNGKHGTLDVGSNAVGEESEAPAKIDPNDGEPFPRIQESAGNDSPGRGQTISLPAAITGKLDRAGDVDYFRFAVKPGQEVGVELIVPKGGKLEGHLQLLDAKGELITESERGFLGHRFQSSGTYVVGVRDRELRGGGDFSYRLRLGDIPIVTSAFPLGGQRGTTVPVSVRGVFLGSDFPIPVAIPKDAVLGSSVPVAVTSKLGPVRGTASLSVGDLPEIDVTRTQSEPAALPFVANGRVLDGDPSRIAFTAKKGERLLLTVSARRLGSPLDSLLEIVDEKGDVMPRATLRCQAKTHVTFRDHDSVQGNIRIEQWSDLAIDDLLYVDGDLMKIKNLPPHPDADCSFHTAKGARLAYLDTTPIHHANGVPMYKVSVHPPGTTFPANGFPVFVVPYRNDDGGPGFGRDSRLFFEPPADGVYHAVVRDARGQSGADFSYRLTVRPPRPNFSVAFNPTAPMVPKGGGTSVSVTVDRIDGYDGPIDLRFDNVPAGFHVPPVRIGPGDTTTAVSLYADAEAKVDAKSPGLVLIGEAKIDGATIVQKSLGGLPKIEESGDLVTTTESSAFEVKSGGEGRLTALIERRNGFKGRVPLEVRGLPHGVRVLDVGLNGILINADETRRTIVFAAESWVAPGDYPIVVLSKREGKNTEAAAKAVTLKVVR